MAFPLVVKQVEDPLNALVGVPLVEEIACMVHKLVKGDAELVIDVRVHALDHLVNVLLAAVQAGSFEDLHHLARLYCRLSV